MCGLQIEELQCKFRVHQQLDWEPAVLGLSVCDMDVERAVCSIQCETLQPLYEFIFSEWTQVPATDMKNIKKRLKNGEGEGAREVRLSFNPSPTHWCVMCGCRPT